MDSAAIIGNAAVWVTLIFVSAMSRHRDSVGFNAALVGVGCATTATALLILS